jgi:hypothetical protein
MFSASLYCGGEPKQVCRNKRGVAGSLIWINFDRHALLDVFRKAAGQFIANVDDIRPNFAIKNASGKVAPSAIFSSNLTRPSGQAVSATIDELDNEQITSVTGLKAPANALVQRSDPSVRHHACWRE